MKLFVVAVVFTLLLWLLACAMLTWPQGAQAQAMPTMLSTSWAIGTPTLSPWPPIPTATPTPQPVFTVYLPGVMR
jgi:hypothetical protein